MCASQVPSWTSECLQICDLQHTGLLIRKSPSQPRTHPQSLLSICDPLLWVLYGYLFLAALSPVYINISLISFGQVKKNIPKKKMAKLIIYSSVALTKYYFFKSIPCYITQHPFFSLLTLSLSRSCSCKCDKLSRTMQFVPPCF